MAFVTLPLSQLKLSPIRLLKTMLLRAPVCAAYDGNKSWSPQALPYVNPCWNTADDPEGKFQDGGLPCIFCPIDIEGHVFHDPNVSVATEFCEIDAVEDTVTVTHAVKQLRAIASSASTAPFYLAVGVHKVRADLEAPFAHPAVTHSDTWYGAAEATQ